MSSMDYGERPVRLLPASAGGLTRKDGYGRFRSIIFVSCWVSISPTSEADDGQEADAGHRQAAGGVVRDRRGRAGRGHHPRKRSAARSARGDHADELPYDAMLPRHGELSDRLTVLRRPARKGAKRCES